MPTRKKLLDLLEAMPEDAFAYVVVPLSLIMAQGGLTPAGRRAVEAVRVEAQRYQDAKAKG